jgi:DNA-binding MarR family transcriptional regulator
LAMVRHIVCQLSLLELQPGRPEGAEHRPRRGVQIGADGLRRRSLTQTGKRLQGDLLGQVFGVRTVPDSGHHEGVDALELLKSHFHHASLHVPPLCNSLVREIHGDENLQAARRIPYTRAVAEDSDWTDSLLASWAAVQPWFEPATYDVTARISRIALHVARRQEEVFSRFGLNRGDVGVLSALRFAGPSQQLSPTQLFKGLMLSSAGITSRLDRLEKRGLVRRERHPNDRRGVLVELTDEGRVVLDESVKANTVSEREFIKTLDADEARQLAGLLKKMLAGLET